MANNITNIYFSNTFGDLVRTANNLVNAWQYLGFYDWDKPSGTFSISSSGTGFLSNTISVFSRETRVEGVGSSLYVQNNAGVGKTLSLTDRANNVTLYSNGTSIFSGGYQNYASYLTGIGYENVNNSYGIVTLAKSLFANSVDILETANVNLIQANNQIIYYNLSGNTAQFSANVTVGNLVSNNFIYAANNISTNRNLFVSVNSHVIGLSYTDRLQANTSANTRYLSVTDDAFVDYLQANTNLQTGVAVANTRVVTGIVQANNTVIANTVTANSSVTSPTLHGSSNVFSGYVQANTRIVTGIVQANTNVFSNTVSANSLVTSPTLHGSSNVFSGYVQANTRVVTGIVQANTNIFTATISANSSIVTPTVQASSNVYTGFLKANNLIVTDVIESQSRVITDTALANTRIITATLQSNNSIISNDILANTRVVTGIVQANTHIYTDYAQANTRVVTGIVQANTHIYTDYAQANTRVVTGIVQANNTVIANTVSANSLVTTPTLHGSSNVFSGYVQANTRVVTGIVQANTNVITNDVLANTRVVTGIVQANTNVFSNTVSANSLVTTPTLHGSSNVFSGYVQANTAVVTGIVQANNTVIANTVSANSLVTTPTLHGSSNVFSGYVQANTAVVTGIVQANTRVVTGIVQANTNVITNDVLANTRVVTGIVQANTNIFSNNIQANTRVVTGIVQANTNVFSNDILANTRVVTGIVQANTLTITDVLQSNSSINTRNISVTSNVIAKNIIANTDIISLGYSNSVNIIASNNIDANSVGKTFGNYYSVNNVFSNNISSLYSTVLGKLTVVGDLTIAGTTTQDSTVLRLTSNTPLWFPERINVPSGITVNRTYNGNSNTTFSNTYDAKIFWTEQTKRWRVVQDVDTNFSSNIILETDTSISNTVNKIVVRDSSGNFAAGTITASLSGNATSSDKVNTVLTRGSYLTGNNFDGSAATTWAVDAATTNTGSKVVARDASGNFAAGTITASLSGNASTATRVNNVLTRGIYLTGSNFDGSAATTWAVDATTTNTGSKVVARDSSGNFAAGTITASLSGNASTATTLQTARTINAVSFNGSANILMPNLFGTNGTSTLQTVGVTSGVNYATITNSVTNSPVLISSNGSDTNVGLTLSTKGAGAITLDTGVGLGTIDLKPGTSNVRFWDDDNSNYWEFVTANTTANYTVTLPTGNVELTPGTMVPNSTTLTIANGTGITGGGSAVDLSANRSWTIGLTGQALNLHNMATTGLFTRTSAGAITARSIAVSGTGISITNADGSAGNPTITSNATSANTGGTIVSRDANGDFSARYISATYLNSTDNSVSSGVTGLMSKTSDSYLRTASAGAVASFLSGQTMNIVGTSTGVTGGAGAVNASTGSFGSTVSVTGQLTSTTRLIASGTQAYSSLGIATGSLGGIEVQGPNNTSVAFMAFNRNGAYATYFGLGTNNRLQVGGWSAGTTSYNIPYSTLGINFDNTDQGGTPARVWGSSNDGTTWYEYNPANFSVLYATSAGSATTAGNATTVTNGVYTTGSYADPAWITSLSKSKVGLSVVENTALSTWAGSSNLTTLGNATAQSLIVTGNLTVNGTTTTVDSSVVVLNDPVLTLGGRTAVAETVKDRGIEFKWGGVALTMTNFIGNGTTTVTGTVASTSGFAAGDIITISGASGTEQSKLNGTWKLESVPTGTTFTFIVSSSVTSGTYTSGIGTSVKSKNGFFGLDQNTGKFTFIPQSNNTNEVFSGTLGLIEPGVLGTGTANSATYLAGNNTWQTINKSTIGLGNVENTTLSTWAGSSNITTLGTIATGTWNATTIGTNKGGTGLTAFTSGGAVYATSTSALTTGTLPVTAGGTGGTTAGTARTGIGATTVGSNLFTLTNPSAVTFLRVNADNTVSSLNASDFKTALSLNSVENTALSTWAGSSNITTVGTLANLTVTNTITGSVSGNANTVTNGVYTSRTLTIVNGTGITGGGSAVDLSANRSWTIGLTGQANNLHNMVTNGSLFYRNGSGAIQGINNFAGLSITSDLSGNMYLVNTGASGISGTANQVIVSVATTSLGTKDYTLSLPQNIATSSSPTFAGLTVGNLNTNNNGYVGIGDDVTLRDYGSVNSFRVQGQQNPDQGYICFGNSNNTTLGRTGTGALTYGGDFTAAGNITAFSDKTLKKDVITLENSLDKVLNLRGVSFTKIDSNKKGIGVIAQEVQEVLPEVVVENSDGILSVAYGNIVGVLIEAIKEQQKQIDELKSKIGN